MQAPQYFPPKLEHSSKRFVTHIRYLIETCLLTSTILTQKKIFSILLLIIRKHLLSCPILVKYPFPKHANLSQSISSIQWLKIEYSFPYLYHIGKPKYLNSMMIYWYMISEEIFWNQTLRYKQIIPCIFVFLSLFFSFHKILSVTLESRLWNIPGHMK